MSKIQDAAKRVKALANQYQGVIELAAVADEIVKFEGYLGELKRDADAKKVERDQLNDKSKLLSAEVSGATAQLNKLKAEADAIIKDARADALSRVRQAERTAQEKQAEGEAAKAAILKDARAEAKKIADSMKQARGELATKLQEVEAAQAELDAIEQKKREALEELKKSLGL